MAASIVEVVTGRPFEEVAVENGFEPLGMSSSSFRKDARVEPNLATGYRADGQTERPYLHIGVRPSGTLKTTPSDLARLGQLLLGKGEWKGTRVLAESTVARMERGRCSSREPKRSRTLGGREGQMPLQSAVG